MNLNSAKGRSEILSRALVLGSIESIGIYGNYSHGTHVAGMTLEGNPFARLLVARIMFGYELGRVSA